MKHFTYLMIVAGSVCFVPVVDAQRPQQRGQQNARAPRGNGQGVANQGVANQGFANQGFANQAGMQNGQNQMGGVQQLAQMMLRRFDTDGSGELSLSELTAGLTAFGQQMQMQQQGNGQGQMQMQMRRQQNRQAGQQDMERGGRNQQAGGRRGGRSGRQRR